MFDVNSGLFSGPLTRETDVLIARQRFGPESKRKAEALLTTGRVLLICGCALALIPMLLALPGLILLISGREMFIHGETIWNEIYRIRRF